MDVSKIINPMLGWKLRPVVAECKSAKDLDDIKNNYILMPKPTDTKSRDEWKKTFNQYLK